METVKEECADVSVVNVPPSTSIHFPTLYATTFHTNGFARGIPAANSNQVEIEKLFWLKFGLKTILQIKILHFTHPLKLRSADFIVATIQVNFF
jgi:hypothetical protein